MTALPDTTCATGPDEGAGSLRFSQAVRQRTLRIGVVGLGYAGLPLALRFARLGFGVVGVDIDRARIHDLRRGVSYIEDVADEDLRGAALTVATDCAALQPVDVIVICVPTALAADGGADLDAVDAAVAGVAPLARDGRLLVVQSTVPPGATRRIAERIAGATGRRAGVDYHLAHAPERINPGDARWTLANTPRVVAGLTPTCAERARALFEDASGGVVVAASLEAAELAKLFENSFRLVNIALVNEFAVACRRFGVQAHTVLAAAATKPYGFLPHLPGPGVGGDCVPVDPVFLVDAAREHGQPIRLVELAHALTSERPAQVVADVEAALGGLGGRSVLVLGVAYKAGLSDVRNSPGIQVLEILRAHGAHARYCDPYVATVAVGGREEPSRPWSVEEVGSYDCLVLVTDHAAFVQPPVWRAARLVFDTRGCLPVTDRVRQV